MSESVEGTAQAAVAPVAPKTAGGLLREARQARGLHIAALAASIKVVPRKLELLETDQFDQLPDATFTRALAQTVCRTLKIEAGPILALLPPPSGHRLEQVSEGLNTPFRERPGRLVPQEWAKIASPALWLAALLLIGAAGVYFAPAGWLPFAKPLAKRAQVDDAMTVVGAAPAASTPVAAPVQEVAASAAAILFPPAAQAEVVPALADPATAPAGILQLRTSAPSWVEVIDARGQVVVARLLQPGEDIGFDGVLPLKVRIGNAAGTQLVFRGQALDLAPFTRDNISRLELK